MGDTNISNCATTSMISLDVSTFTSSNTTRPMLLTTSENAYEIWKRNWKLQLSGVARC